MAPPPAVLLDTEDPILADRALRLAEEEAARVEAKFSRYLSGNIVHLINHAGGRAVEVDDETAHLLDYAASVHEMSSGLFDITSGVLRRVWKFDGGDQVPTEAAVLDVLRHVGWYRVTWNNPVLTLPEGMELDLGGIGKEYAVDRAA